MRLSRLLISLSLASWSVFATAASNQYFVRYVESPGSDALLIEAGWDDREFMDGSGRVQVSSMPQMIAEHDTVSPAKIVRIVGASQEQVEEYLAAKGIVLTAPKDDPMVLADESITLVNNGPSANRVDLVFMGDGYTVAEKEKFHSDIRQLVRQMFESETFKSYLPIFNVHAVFRASNESGIGRNDTPKDTAYRLYRAGNTLRAIYPGNQNALRASCRVAPACDYPIVIANDPYYGGLGGEFAISTSSPDSGIVVLRHELGHQVGEVGEEYDGGGYFGANHASSLATLGWKQWLSGPLEAEPQVARYIAWPWKNLSEGSFVANFTSDGQQGRTFINFSASGMEQDNDIEFRLDGVLLPVRSPHTADRAFHDVALEHGLTAGNHTLEVSEGRRDGNNWFSSASIHEYGPGFHHDNDYVSAYPLVQDDLAADGFRPTSEGCLMRNMMNPKFCSVCKENNWLKFFRKISVIDSVGMDNAASPAVVRLKTPALGQLRQDRLPGETLAVRWIKNGSEVLELAGKWQWTPAAGDSTHRWEVEVTFLTPEVRKDTELLLHKRMTVTF